jgi:hypothetical protein
LVLVVGSKAQLRVEGTTTTLGFEGGGSESEIACQFKNLTTRSPFTTTRPLTDTHTHTHIMAAAAPKNSADVSTLALSHVNLAHLTSRTTTSTRHWSGHTLLMVKCLCSRSDDQDERFWVGSLTRHITCSFTRLPCAGPGEVQEDHHARYRWPGQVRIHFSRAPTPSRERHCFTSKESKRAPRLIRAGREGPTGPLTYTSSHWHRIHSKGSIHIIQSICMVLVCVGNACARVIYHTHLAVSHHAVLLLCRHFCVFSADWLMEILISTSMSRPPRICHLMARKEAPLSLLFAPFSCVQACYCGWMLPALLPWSERSSCELVQVLPSV